MRRVGRFRAATAAHTGEPSTFDRLSTIRFPLALSMLFLHNDRGADLSGRLHDSAALAEFVRFLSVGIGGFRLPTFFLIAGYLFFRSAEPTAAWFGGKITARVRSLMLPLLAWNLFGLALLGIAQQIPALASFLNSSSDWSTPVSEFTGSQLAVALVGGPQAQPLIYPLWFLRDLFALVLLTPLIFAAITASRGMVTLAVALLWVTGVRNPLVSQDALFFFFVGCHVAIARRSLFALDALGPVAAIGWLGLQLASVQALMEPLQVAHLRALSGVIAVLTLSGVLARRTACVRWSKSAEPFGVFLFFAHEPLLTVTRKASLRLLHLESPPALLIAYLGGVAVVTGVLFGAFQLARWRAPRLLATLTGGRAGGGGRPAPATAIARHRPAASRRA